MDFADGNSEKMPDINNDASITALEDYVRRNEERRWRIVMENSPVGFNIFTKSGNMMFANSAMCKQFGCATKDEYLENWMSTFPKYQEDGQNTFEKFKAAVATAFEDGFFPATEWQMQTIHGEPIPILMDSVVIDEAEGPLLVSFATDLRPIKHATERLKEAEERASVLANAMPMPSVLINSRYELVELNQAAVNLFARSKNEPFKYTTSEDGQTYYCDGPCEECPLYRLPSCVARSCLGINWRHTLDGYAENPEQIMDDVKNMCKAADEKGQNVQTNYMKTLSGTALVVETTMVPVRYMGEPAYAVYMRDLHESQAREAAEAESRAKTRFLAQMSHEIRTPMNAVLGVTAIQLQRKDLQPETENAFLRIHTSSNLLLSLINDILDVAKVEAGKMEIIPREYELLSMIVDTAQLYMMQASSKKLGFKLHVDENLPRYMVGDDKLIRQIMNNLLSNAHKYTSEGEVTLVIRREIIPEDDIATMLVIEISDTGQGMTKAQISTLFEQEFNRLNLHVNHDVQGTGLGMTLTHHFVNLMNGKISVESTPGKGSTFTVRIPQVVENDDILGTDALNLQNIETLGDALKKVKKIEREQMSYGSVLVVDDMESNLYVAMGMLEPYKLSVTTAMSGVEAVEYVRNGKMYDIIFMDHMMPDMDGIEATRLIREEGYALPIVALTANIIAGQEELFLSSGFNGFISKPIDTDKLDACLKRFIKDAPQQTDSPATSANVLSEALVSSFLRDASKVVSILTGIHVSDVWNEENLRLYAIHVHAIKTALANVNETSLSTIAYSLEESARIGDANRLAAETGLFLKKLAEVVQKFTPADTTATANEEDLTLLHTQFEIIANACDAYDKRTAKEALAALQGKPWSFETKALIERVTTELLHSDFEKAADVARGRE